MRVRRSLFGFLILISLSGACSQSETLAQKKAAAPGRSATPAESPSRGKAGVKAVWEPVNYKEDLQLNDVCFVNDQVGWVTGSANAVSGGVILHTRDGGENWAVQLGDSQSQEKPFMELRFVDEKHGWAVQPTGGPAKLLRTADAETWEQIGQIEEHHGDYQFTTAATGFYVSGDAIFRAQDGGRKWQKVYACQPKTEVNGLMQNIDCKLRSLHFPTPSTGYAVGQSYKAGGTAIIAKTVDGGATWQIILAPETGSPEEVCFTGENTGFFRIYGGRVFGTSDGGQTWRGVAATARSEIKFADSEVGWSFLGADRTLSFTTDGGKRWTSRQFPFPAVVNAFSLPRRDRGYVVGDHGMIYRYRVAPGDYTTRGMIPAPMMSAGGLN